MPHDLTPDDFAAILEALTRRRGVAEAQPVVALIPNDSESHAAAYRAKQESVSRWTAVIEKVRRMRGDAAQ